MIQVRKAADRGIVDHGWLLARHTFSFANYHDPAHVHFRDLRVINEDTVKPGEGFGTHPHADMEIVTYVLEGALEHNDSMGNRGVLRPGDVQVMSAGTGLTHSEVNHSRTEDLHLLQIWILPDRKGHEPRWEDRFYSADERRDRLCLVASGDPASGALHIHQDASVHAALLSSGAEVAHDLAAGRHAWIQVAAGTVELDGIELAAGDGAAVSDAPRLTLRARDDAELLLFDLR